MLTARLGTMPSGGACSNAEVRLKGEVIANDRGTKRLGRAIALVVVLVVGVALCYVQWSGNLQGRTLSKEVHRLRAQVAVLEEQQAMPSIVVNRYRDSICYIVGTYKVGFPGEVPARRTRISGSGFLVSPGLIATNRHVAEPWYKDRESEALIRMGASPSLESLVAYFPGLSTPIQLRPVVFSKTQDLALVKMRAHPQIELRPLPLASKDPQAGELVAVVGYPMGAMGMVAKSPAEVSERLASARGGQNTADELANLALIRPSATCGHLGDVLGETLLYDAPTARGASGGPVFNSHAEVVGVNQGYIDGFSGGSLGISWEALQPLIDEARKGSGSG